MAREEGTSLSSSSFAQFNEELQSAALFVTKASTSLPVDIAFHRSVDPVFGSLIESTSHKALALTNRLLKLASTSSKTDAARRKGKLKLEDEADVADRFESLVVDVLDQLFEDADVCLDNYFGRNRSVVTISTSGPSTSQTRSVKLHQSTKLDPSLIHASNIPKPQARFRQPVDNHSSWKPSLKHKYNAQVPLGHIFVDDDISEPDASPVAAKHRHPYEYELKHLSYPRCMFEHCEPIHPKSFEDTTCTWVDSVESFNQMLNHLRNVREIAVDLEYHSHRTFAGFVCLMQISSRNQDFIVDTLILREELEELNEVFTDPKILKAFHGAESDIVWLQQNFNIYVVNLFDTYHASKELDFPRHGLAALLEMYCDFVPDKRYQLADWRIRPLPEAMLNYARSDTHFLLYIYDNLRNVLLDRSGGNDHSVRNVLNRSQETSLRTYESEIYDYESGAGPAGWNTLMQKWNKTMSGAQLAVFRAIHHWRDSLARKEDESVRFVLPNNYLFQLAERPPEDVATLLSIFRSVPALIRSNAASLLDVIRASARDAQQKATPVDVTPSVPRQLRISEPLKVLSSNDSTGIWSNANKPITTSTLLNSASSSKIPNRNMQCLRSNLFPSGWTMPAAETNGLHPRYQDVMSKIHAKMGLAPGIPPPEIDHQDLNVAKVDVDETVILPGQVEIPFVPSAQREKVKAEEPSAIVVVGLPGKKRKRSKEENDSNKKTREHLDSKPFDFDAEPNLLDGNSNRQSIKEESRPKGRNGPKMPYGSFPAPPRAFNEVKSGNQSHTFR